MVEPYDTNDVIRKMPVGIHDFKEIREKNYLYIDKSEMIARVVLSGIEVY
jgi:hypothetical protein